MMPTLFERDCQSCHSLAFDALHEDDEAPHEEVVLVSASTFQFYSALALEGEARDPEAPLPARRRPGREISEVERLGLVAWAEERTARALDRLLGSEGVCVECHTVSGTGEIAEVERLTPVPSTEGIGWMPAAVFSHQAHDSISECEDCHSGVSEAEADSALLLPQIQLCLECHTGATPSAQRVTSPCVLCHSFHRPRYGLLRSE